MANEFTWGQVLTCNTDGGGLGADCNGYPQNAFRYDTPTWWGFSVSTSYGEDDMWDVALKYAADWNSVKFSAAAGYTQLTDEGCSALGVFQGRTAPTLQCRWRRHAVPKLSSGWPAIPDRRVHHARPVRPVRLWLVQNDQEDGTQFRTSTFHKSVDLSRQRQRSNETTAWFVKAGIKRAWMPAGRHGAFRRVASITTCSVGSAVPAGQPQQLRQQRLRHHHPDQRSGKRTSRDVALVTDSIITGSEVDRWGIGVVQEIDSAAMHLFARWQHLELEA